MYKKGVLIISFILCCLYGMAQTSINNYEYVVVPLKYDFLKEKDKYRLNTLTKYLFKQNGFTAFYDEQQLPDDLSKDRCKGLNVDVEKLKGGLFATKLEIVLKNCYGEEVFRSRTGSTKEKDYKKAYAEALREAFVSIEELNYKYQPTELKVESNVVKNETIEEEVKISEVDKEKPKIKIEKNVKADVKEPTKVKEIKREDIKEQHTKKTKQDNELFYAQTIENGYQLVNSEPKIVMTLLNTAAKDVYLVKGKSAIVFKEDGFWYYSENDGNLKEKKQLNIKF